MFVLRSKNNAEHGGGNYLQHTLQSFAPVIPDSITLGVLFQQRRRQLQGLCIVLLRSYSPQHLVAHPGEFLKLQLCRAAVSQVDGGSSAAVIERVLPKPTVADSDREELDDFRRLAAKRGGRSGLSLKPAAASSLRMTFLCLWKEAGIWRALPVAWKLRWLAGPPAVPWASGGDRA